MFEEFSIHLKDQVVVHQEEKLDIKNENDYLFNEIVEYEKVEDFVRFSCAQCKYVGKCVNDLNKHISRRHIQIKKNVFGIFNCEHCEYESKWRENLIIHMQKHDEVMHYCSKCQYKSISEYNLKRHTRHSHSDQRFSCDRCEYSAKDAYSVKLHKKVHEGILNNCDQYIMGEHSHHLKYQVVMKENRRIYRENCALKNVNSDLTSKLKEFKSKVENILRELNEIPQVCGLRDALEIKGREVSRTEIKSNNAPAEKFEGSLNPSAMDESENLQDDHDEDTLDDLLDESVNVQVTITEDIPVVQKENIEENIVFKAEMNESAEHESIEENPTKVSFSCVKCKYIGESLEDLNKHMKRKHIKDSLKKNDLGFYQCTSCTYATKSQGCFILHLQNHEGLVHDCSQCPYKSFSEYNLRVHKRREHGDKRFNCEKCSYSTAVKFRLKTHIKSVHDGVKVSKEFRYICDKCDYKTHLSTYLKNHLQIHGDVIHFCDKCTHSTPSAYNLSKHIKRRHADVC